MVFSGDRSECGVINSDRLSDRQSDRERLRFWANQLADCKHLAKKFSEFAGRVERALRDY